ncbi:c-type cytochrome [Corallococcus aberystwythensis]|uniref:Cytochrome c domain-containing protein n=1 Tax=Corallococcus aberystwythensis TaxID=2316722 RepID=A0A3A8PSK6_9BACT|nr:c-type cytochrome [Corallococcus aberystwythensis]RKH59456.1 hypothetical protein D7W81_27240 [Corallococcus aberystwythensis]
MKRLNLLVLLLAPGLALAQGGGQSAFNRACSRCHVAKATNPNTPKRSMGLKGAYKGSGPNLGNLMHKRTLSQVRTWIAAPHKVKPETGCDTRMLSASETEALLDFLVTNAEVPDTAPKKSGTDTQHHPKQGNK